MDFSITFNTYPDAWKDAQIAEDLGFTNAWFYDQQLMTSDVYACMALAAQHTRRIKLGTGVVAPSNRIAPVTATAIATINYLAPGRVILGVGVGGYSARRAMGMKPIPIKRMKEYIQQVRGLLNGEDVLYREGKRERWIRLLHPPKGWINTDDPIPIFIAANGPKALGAIGALPADGWITWVGGMETTAQQVQDLQTGFASIAAGAQAAKREGAKPYTSVLTTSCVLRDGETLMSPRVVERVGPFAIHPAHASWELRYHLQDAVSEQYSRHTGVGEEYGRYIEEYGASIGSPPDRRYLDVHKGHLLFFKPGEERFLQESMIRATLTARGEEIIERLKAWEAAGVDDVQIQVVGNDGRELVEEFSREVIAKY